MSKPASIARVYGSVYSLPDDAVGDARIYGRFDDQCLLRHPCSIVVTRLEDNDFRALDLLRRPAFCRVGAGIHISGLDPFGERTGPGFIRALGMYSVDWLGGDRRVSGLGCHRPEPAAIITWDGDCAGNYHRRDDWCHHVHYASCESILTLQSVADLFHKTFSADDICAKADRLTGRTAGTIMSYQDPLHVRAVRRLLETHVDVQNNHIQPRAVLRRVKRWTYQWERAR
jgi:hypothetical protein